MSYYRMSSHEKTAENEIGEHVTRKHRQREFMSSWFRDKSTKEYLGKRRKMIHNSGKQNGNRQNGNQWRLRRMDVWRVIECQRVKTVIDVEIDESSHRRYSDLEEFQRYNDLYCANKHAIDKWIFIRFNPDIKRENHALQMKKHLVLDSQIRRHSYRASRNLNKNIIEVYYIFYKQSDLPNFRVVEKYIDFFAKATGYNVMIKMQSCTGTGKVVQFCLRDT